jgi:hypothetical protein
VRRGARQLHDLHRIASVELAAHLDHADRQQAGAPSRTARAAPSSITIVPREGLAYFSHSLKLE